MNKIQEAVKVNNGKLVYVVQLTTKNNEKLQLYYEEKNIMDRELHFQLMILVFVPIMFLI